MITFVIVGTGQTGCSAAMELRSAGFSGRIVTVGNEPHLPYERPPLSKSVLSGETAHLREMRPCKALIESGVELELTQLADPSVVLRTLATATASSVVVDSQATREPKSCHG